MNRIGRIFGTTIANQFASSTKMTQLPQTSLLSYSKYFSGSASIGRTPEVLWGIICGLSPDKISTQRRIRFLLAEGLRFL
jgi:hypothetical protein